MNTRGRLIDVLGDCGHAGRVQLDERTFSELERVEWHAPAAGGCWPLPVEKCLLPKPRFRPMADVAVAAEATSQPQPQSSTTPMYRRPFARRLASNPFGDERVSDEAGPHDCVRRARTCPAGLRLGAPTGVGEFGGESLSRDRARAGDNDLSAVGLMGARDRAQHSAFSRCRPGLRSSPTAGQNTPAPEPPAARQIAGHPASVAAGPGCRLRVAQTARAPARPPRLSPGGAADAAFSPPRSGHHLAARPSTTAGAWI